MSHESRAFLFLSSHDLPCLAMPYGNCMLWTGLSDFRCARRRAVLLRCRCLGCSEPAASARTISVHGSRSHTGTPLRASYLQLSARLYLLDLYTLSSSLCQCVSTGSSSSLYLHSHQVMSRSPAQLFQSNRIPRHIISILSYRSQGPRSSVKLKLAFTVSTAVHERTQGRF